MSTSVTRILENTRPESKRILKNVRIVNPEIKRILKNARIVNPITKRIVSKVGTIEKLLKKGVNIKIPDTLLYDIRKNEIFISTPELISSYGPNFIIENNIVKETFDSFIEKMKNQLGTNEIIISTNGGKKFFTITEQNIQDFKEYRDLPEEDSFHQAMVDAFEFGDYEFVSLAEGISRQEGGYFPYIVPMSGLEKYGLYSKYSPKNYSDSCLVHAFKNSKIFTENEIDRMKVFCKSGIIPQKCLREISETMDVHIIYKGEDIKDSYKHYNKEAKRIINIAKIKGHYFLNEKTNFTSYAIKNWDNLPDVKNKTHILNNKNNKSKSKTLGSYKIINLILAKCKLTEIDRSQGDVIYNHKTEEIVKCPTILYEKEMREIKPRYFLEEKQTEETTSEEVERGEKQYAFFDVETCPGNRGEEHIPYLCVLRFSSGRTVEFRGFDCIRKFLNFVKKRKNLILYAHNLRYDLGFVLKETGFRLTQVMKSGSKWKMAKGMFYGGELLEFKDSYSIIPAPLGDFGKMFDLEVEKDVMPYRIYTKANLKKGMICKQICLKSLSEKDRIQFLENCEKIGFTGEEVDIMEYASYYCKKDCEVLHKGFERFRTQIKNLTNVETLECVSLPQIVNEYMKKKLVFEGCYEYSGTIRRYFDQFKKGGRCMMADNKKQHIKKPIADFDGVSLYPSAMMRMLGYELGKPKILLKKQLNKRFLDKCDNYYVTIKIKKVGKNRRFPLISYRDENGIRQYKNAKLDRFYACKTELEDLIKFQKIEFDIIEGLYFNEGFNRAVPGIMQVLFDERVKMKKQGNPIQNTLKLLMNSSYGKLLIKPIDTKFEFAYSTKEFNKKTKYSYNQIMEVERMGEMHIFKLRKAVNTSFNSSNLGSSVLAMSKRIMNEVITLDEKSMFYTDTDSIHIYLNSVQPLAAKYREVYGKELIGNNPGQFHTDFDKINNKDSWAKETIIVGKKSYYDRLVNEDGDEMEHFRLKGIPQDCVRNDKTLIKQQYTDFFNGHEKSYDLLEHTVCFKSLGFNPVSNYQSFERKVSF